FVPGAPAKAPVVGSAATAALREWRQAGHPKASVKSQDIIARHKAGELDVDIKIDPDQRLRFGTVTIKGESDVRRKRIREILGWPEGEIYDPELQNEAGNRLRRAGAFKTVSLQEGEVVGDQLNYNLTVIDQPKRRFGFSAELATVEGLQVGGFWMHRNVFGGSERFRVDAEVSNIGGEQSGLGDKGGVDYSTTFRLTRPAAYGPDNWAFLYGEFEHLDEPDYTETQATLGIGITRYFSDRLFGEIALGYRYSYADDAFGEHDFNHIVFPSRLEWDYRDEIGDPKTGVYFDGRAMPFFGVNGSEDGALIDLDNRGYLSFGAEDKFTLAGRAQIGSVLFASQEGTPPDFLFYSGGGDTVRGQKYQSLGANEINGDAVGGRSFLALSGEIRARVTKSLGVVGFYDIGYVGAESWLEADDP
ncbi:MAG: autotransporter assembly complex protein TamA, partial [Mangrovicoccus sp.]